MHSTPSPDIDNNSTTSQTTTPSAPAPPPAQHVARSTALTSAPGEPAWSFSKSTPWKKSHHLKDVPSNKAPLKTSAAAISRLATETLSHVFAHLSPASLAVAQLVCREWNSVIKDDASWRSAYEMNYGILRHEGAKPSLGRRVAIGSWRNEYTTRQRLLSRWTKSRTPSITHDPRLGFLTHLHVNFTSSAAPTVLSISLPSGSGTLSDPFRGKVTKRSLAATPTTMLGQALHPHLPLVQTTCVALSGDGTRVVWGMQDGSIRLVDSSVPTNATGRAWQDDRVRPLLPPHGSEVVEMAFGEDGIMASVDVEGDVVIWAFDSPGLVTGGPGAGRRDAVPAKRIWESNALSTAVAPVMLRTTRTANRPTTLAFVTTRPQQASPSLRVATLVLGLNGGSIVHWTKLALDLDVPSPIISPDPPTWLEGSRNGEEIERLVLDGTESVFVYEKGEATFRRHSLTGNDERLVFGHLPGHVGTLTAFAFDFASPPPLPAPSVSPHRGVVIDYDGPPRPSSPVALPALPQGMNAFGRRKYVVAGDAQGRVFMWDWEAEEPTAGTDVVLPSRLIQSFEVKVTALEITDFGIFVGGVDGVLRCYDPLTSTLVRCFKDRAASRLAARLIAAGTIEDEARWKVGAISATPESVVAAIGNRVLAWRVAETVKRRQNKAASGNGRMSARTERFRSEYELRQEVRESLSSLSSESQSRLARINRDRQIVQDFGLPPSLETMTEEEAVAFALMLSVDDQEARWIDGSAASNDSSPAFEPVQEDEILDMDGLMLDDTSSRPWASPQLLRRTSEIGHSGLGHGSDDEGVVEEEDMEWFPSRSSSATSRSLSIPTSAFVRGGSLGNDSPSLSRSWTPTWRPSSVQSSSSSTSTKVQVSPRLGPTYGSSSPSIPSIVPDMSDELWPTAGTLASTSSLSHDPRPRPPSTPPVTRRGWNDVARSASASPSPSFAPPLPSTTTASLLTARLRQDFSSPSPSFNASPHQGLHGSRIAREEEELRFALELSLAEQVSRTEL